MRRKILLIPLALLLAISLVAIGCAAPAPVPAPTPEKPEVAITPAPVTPAPAPAPAPVAEVYKIRFTTLWDAGLLGHRITEAWAEDLKTASGGRLDMEVYPAGAIVATFDTLDACTTGVLDGMNQFPAYWPGKQPAFVYLTSYAYGLDDPQMWDIWYEEMGGDEIATDAWAFHNIHFVDFTHEGPNYAHCIKPLHTAEDWIGLKCRYPGGMIEGIYSKFGASVIILPGGEIYTALATGVIDLGEFIGHAMNKELGLHEVGHYIIGPGKMHQPCDLRNVVFNMDTWNKLPDDLKALLEMGVRDFSWKVYTATHLADKIALSWMVDEYGCEYLELPDAERAKFRAAAPEMWKEYARDGLSNRAAESQIILMREEGLLDFPGVKAEVEKYFPGLLAKPLSDFMKVR